MGREPLWCEDCGQSHLGDCPVHGPLLKVRDKSIPTRARLTLPHYLMLKDLELRTANQQVVGVFARKLIQQRTQFGPFIAPRVPKLETLPHDNSPIYKVFKNGKEVAALDLSSENSCSWMMFVRLATTYEEQNLVAYQFNEEIYFATCKPVAPHAELKVWYASDYARNMNITLLCADKPDGFSKKQASLPEVQSIDEQHQLDLKETFGKLHEKDKNNNSACTNSCEPWKCSNCNQMFGTFSLLEQHSCESKKAKPGRKQKVKRSHSRFIVRQSQVNVQQMEGKKDNQVNKEGIAGPSKSRVRKEPLTFACHLCSKVFLNHDKLKTHSYMHTGERPFLCTNSQCTKAFVSKYKLLRHMTTHSPMKIHICSYCDKKFHRKDHLKNHLQTHDPNKASFRCSFCGKMYNTKPGFKKHMALHAAASGELTCRICDKDFGNTPNLLEHIKFHSGKSSGAKEKKHRCEHCDRQFYTRKDVRRHMVVHTGRKDFLCQVCGQRFGRKDHLVRHTRKSHDSINTQVKLDEQVISPAKIQQMLHNHQFQGQLHPFTQESPLHCSVGQIAPSSNQLTELLKIPPMPSPKYINKMSHEINSPVKQTLRTSLRDKVQMMATVDSGSLNLRNITGESLCMRSVDLGQDIGTVPVQQVSQPLASSSMPSATMSPSPTAPIQLSQEPTCQLQQHQTHLQQLQQPSFQQQTKLPKEHVPPQQQQLQAGHSSHSLTETTNSHSCSNILQVPFVGLRSSLPRFHQAFQ
ncbi:zinc finger protein PLAG1-like isoform X2 [Acanthaster planci]|uniref:Zinc finger protein PLAG1-like isoform X2 n=1 Tax=Acanthaster planci TaxID=133434 RepID=A0A8B7ZSG4_ACAPL|nr:zinc finger protein PLAG1-like isoform X2 [Acanthaster planci]XP_022107806.1 zinc finger protein PLAG1-like isoform X2 [Acanthaster planci]XP_022107807.1 zinc finger protein PLAG1-like isoform X2 [Acanthaster planci]